MTRCITTLFALLALGAPALAQDEMRSSDVKKIVRAVGSYVVADLSGDIDGKLDAREDIQDTLDDLAKKYPGPEVYRYIEAWSQALAERDGDYPRQRGGELVEDELPNGIAMNYWVPEEYDPKDAGSPLVLWFRDAELTEDDVEGIPEAVRNNFAVVAVDLAGTQGDEQVGAARVGFFLGVAWISQKLRIDRDRVYVIADSPHAGIAGTMTALAPHFLGGAAIVGELPALPEGNLAMTTLESVDSLEQAWTWVQEAPARTPYPTEFSVELTRPEFGRFAWVQATRFDAVEGESAKMSVSVDRDANRITLDCEKVYQVDLYLNDRIVDLSQPIILVRNGEELEITATPGFMTLLQNFRATLFDSGVVFPAQVKAIDIPTEESAESESGTR